MDLTHDVHIMLVFLSILLIRRVISHSFKSTPMFFRVYTSYEMFKLKLVLVRRQMIYVLCNVLGSAVAILANAE